MSQITTYFNGSGSGTVASVTGGVGINITGNPSLNPVVNLDVPVTIAHGGTNATSMTNTFGVNYFDGTRIVTTPVGTAGQILQSNGPGVAPTFVSIAAGGVVSVAGGHDINITGTATNPIVNVNNAITLGDLSSIIGSDALHATTGDITLVAGNINLPATNTAGTEGVVTLDGAPFISAHIGSGGINTFVGYFAGNTTLTGSLNSGFGSGTGISLTTGNRNTFIGAGSGSKISTGSDNVGVGEETLYSTDSDSGITTGSQNTIIGSRAGSNMSSSASNNILIGWESGVDYEFTESSNLIIGNVGIVSENNTMRIGTQGSSAAEQNRCFVAGIVGVTTSNSEMVTIDSTTGQLGAAALPTSFTWSTITADQTAAVHNGYICNKAGLLTLTLPTTSAVGDFIEVTGINTNLGWKIAQNSSQIIHFGNTNTTSGMAGSLASSLIYDSVRIVCNVANLEWIVLSSIGSVNVI